MLRLSSEKNRVSAIRYGSGRGSITPIPFTRELLVVPQKCNEQRVAVVVVALAVAPTRLPPHMEKLQSDCAAQ